ncbi:MAG TPA: hypothetical protein VHO94_06370 [Oscillospiraceae bacterium]|nr:hypothetical protein [Oscillospiraceae bacterium]
MLSRFLLFFKVLFRLPHFFFLVIVDFIKWLRNKGWLIFEGWGLHIYVGRFGAGKTCTMVNDAYLLAKRYPQLHIVTNLKLVGFPAHTEILPLKTPSDILNAPKNTLVLIDEIGTIFNSRDFAASKVSVPKILFQHICQVRKRHLMIYATSQRWNFVDKQLRDITATVRVCSVQFPHPFCRMGTVHVYDSYEYDLAFSNPLLPLNCLDAYCYVQTDEIRKLYDTEELIQNMLNDKYVSDEEILRNRGDLNGGIGEVSKDGSKAYRKNRKVV